VNSIGNDLRSHAGEAERAWHAADQVQARITGKEKAADGVVMLTLEVPGRTVPLWEPGAHIDLELRSGLVRQYSLCGDPEDRTRLQVAVLREPASRGGSRMIHQDLGPGDTVGVRGPRNHFQLVGAQGYAFIAGGIGITPILAMIRSVEQSAMPWQLLYGGRQRSSMAFTADLQALGRERILLCPEDETGLLDLASFLENQPPGTAVYCCGPEPLLTAVEMACIRLGLTLHLERFGPALPIEHAGDSSFEVELRRSSRLLHVREGTSLLDALLADGVDIEFSCSEGTCGTCETQVLGGVPDHYDSLLTEEERAAGDVIFPCVSRCKSGPLGLDL
jgi:ferredoxin-NADP reductase